jgi:hypothetical protein
LLSLNQEEMRAGFHQKFVGLASSPRVKIRINRSLIKLLALTQQIGTVSGAYVMRSDH